MEDHSGRILETIRAQQEWWTITSTMIDFPHEDYETLESIRASGGVAPDAHWDEDRNLFLSAAKLTASLGGKYLSMHAGFIDESKPEYAGKMRDRIRTLADIAATQGTVLLLETGQETAGHMKQFIESLEHEAIGVNFDPANMILYGMGDPIDAVRVLRPWIRHIHIKDARRAERAGTWGKEVPWGTGDVGCTRFLDVLEEVRFDGAMAIEREQDENRFGDIESAVKRLEADSK